MYAADSSYAGAVDVSLPRPCGVAETLELVGERWSLLIVRELFYGVRRFDTILRATGAPRNMLATRLRTLQEAGIIDRRPYTDRPPRYEYFLTDAGTELVPVLLTLQAWADRHLSGHLTIPIRHNVERHSARGGRAHRLRADLVCRTCGEAVIARDLSLGSADPWADAASAPHTHAPAG